MGRDRVEYFSTEASAADQTSKLKSVKVQSVWQSVWQSVYLSEICTQVVLAQKGLTASESKITVPWEFFFKYGDDYWTEPVCSCIQSPQ